MVENTKPERDRETSGGVSSARLNCDLEEGLDYYMETGLMVFTEAFLERRGYCCERGCRHCPYGFTDKPNEDESC